LAKFTYIRVVQGNGGKKIQIENVYSHVIYRSETKMKSRICQAVINPPFDSLLPCLI